MSFVGMTSISIAQDFKNANLQAIVDAERAFINMAKEQNTRDAFLFYLSDDVVTTGPNGPIIGKEHLKKQQPNTSWLFWEVAYSDIAASGDFGYNTGPWEFRQKKTDEKPVAFGEFNSIWKKQSDGSWKNVLDIGVRHGAPIEKVVVATSERPLTKITKAKSASGKEDVLKTERDFLAQLTKNKEVAYSTFLSTEARLVHSGNLPVIKTEEKQKFINSIVVPDNLQLMEGDAASSNDLGYVYGKGEVKVTKDGKTETKIAVYFRVWKKEDGRNWKIVLDVLSY
ncbi:hypothetical protein WSM22_29460 [Cytophagales bacterium WSM2-2]|nr:hypothetical protein WSM22_29460 [Cytophagales bacterium WSM2-2]